MNVTNWQRWADMPEFHELPNGWSIDRLTGHIDVIAGQSPPSETYNDKSEGMPFLQGCTEFGDEIPVTKFWCTAPSKIAPSNSTLMSVRAPVGELNRADQDYAIGRGLAALVAKGMNPDFLYYGLHRWRQSFQRLGQGSTFEAITARQLKQVIIAVPTDADEQRRIAAALKLTDDAIAKAKAELQATRELKRSIENALLTGKLDGKNRPKQKTKAGELPNDWNVAPLKSVAVIDSGITLNEDRAPRENPCRYLTVAHVQRGVVSSEDPRYLELSETERETRLLVRGDVLVVEGHANSLEIGRAAMFEGFDEPTTYQNHLFRVRPDVQQLLPKFLLYVLNFERVKRHWNAICNTSSGLNTINRRNLRNLLIQFPDTAEQRYILDALEAGESSVAASEQKLVALQQVKKSLLQNLLTGKIRIPEGVIHG
jgi:type I restriction enzyme S subunit